MPSDLVDYLIFKCDEDTPLGNTSTLPPSKLLPISHNPFSAFRLRSTRPTSTNHDDQIIIVASPLLQDIDLAFQHNTLWPSMIENPDLPWNERLLFHHYVQEVAGNMMPFEYSKNPWKFHYPAVALNSSCGDQRALYHGMISHAAFHLAQLGVNECETLSIIGSKSYATSIRELRPNLGTEPTEYAITIASIFSLMFAEVSVTPPICMVQTCR